MDQHQRNESGGPLTPRMSDLPDFLAQAAQVPEMLRLRGVGMNCGCEYTSFPRFAGLPPYSRYAHSLGVGWIAWRFTGEPRQALAALLHDIATPCFAHVIDFLNGDHLTQTSTEAGTAEMIEGSRGIQAVLRSLDLATSEVCDYHAYPVADNDSPRLSADRLEYTLGNAVNFGFCSRRDAAWMVDDLTVGTGEDGAPELMFKSPGVARRFCGCALACSEIYVSDEDRCAMQCLAELLGDAIASGALSRRDLWRTEAEVIARLEADAAAALRWRAFRALNATRRGTPEEDCPAEDGWRIIPAKKRWIDPLVNSVRATALFPDYARDAAAFLAQSQAEPVLACVQT